MPRSFIRRSVRGEWRPVITAMSIPAAMACFMPRPSRILNALISSPLAENSREPSVMTPSTSSTSKETDAAISARCAGNPGANVISDHPCPQQIVHIDGSDKLIIPVQHRQGVDLQFFHHMQCFSGELVIMDNPPVARHNVPDQGFLDINGPVQ